MGFGIIRSRKQWKGPELIYKLFMINFTKITAGLFLLIGVLHTMRLVFGWQVMIGGIEIPFWVSVLALAAALSLAWGLWKEVR